MQCSEIHNNYFSYLEDGTDNVTKSRIEKHLASCSHCRDFVSKLKYAEDLISEEKNITADPFMFNRIQSILALPGKTQRISRRKSLLKLAAAVAFLILGSWMGFSVGKYFSGYTIQNDYQEEIFYLYNIQQGFVENELLYDLTN